MTYTYLSHELKLLNDLFHVVVCRQGVEVLSDVAHKILPKYDWQGGKSFPPLGQIANQRLQEPCRPRQSLKNSNLIVVQFRGSKSIASTKFQVAITVVGIEEVLKL